nr:hypothetical protein [Acidithiobacillus caldus]
MRSAAFWLLWAREDPLYGLRQSREVDHRLNLLQGIANGVHLLDVTVIRQQIVRHRRPTSNHPVYSVAIRPIAILSNPEWPWGFSSRP